MFNLQRFGISENREKKKIVFKLDPSRRSDRYRYYTVTMVHIIISERTRMYMYSTRMT